ncbi:MAG TPA: HAD family hydrolase [Gaiellaceae bacterium]|nr:HAD family hydrolase [Gaiellaceae bacterium]
MTITFLVDVDNTLLDNDRFRTDVQTHFAAVFGVDVAAHYWAIQERRFVDLGYRDYLGAVQEWWEGEGREPRLLAAARFLLDYPFEDLLYEGALSVLADLGERGQTLVLTDGDAIFQPRKIERSGIGAAVGGRVLVYVHKELELEDVERRYPAERYVLVDDKPRILAAAKAHWGERVTTVLPRQGQFGTVEGATADVAVDRIAELVGVAFDEV